MLHCGIREKGECSNYQILNFNRPARQHVNVNQLDLPLDQIYLGAPIFILVDKRFYQHLRTYLICEQFRTNKNNI